MSALENPYNKQFTFILPHWRGGKKLTPFIYSTLLVILTYGFQEVAFKGVLKKIENISSFVFRNILCQIVGMNVLLGFRKNNCFVLYVKFLLKKKRDLFLITKF